MRYERVLGGDSVEYAERSVVGLTGAVPKNWDDDSAKKWLYSRLTLKASRVRRVRESGIPEWLSRSKQVGAQFTVEDVEDVLCRIAGYWAYWGCKHEVFDDEDSARAFYEDVISAFEKGLIQNNETPWDVGCCWAYGGDIEVMWFKSKFVVTMTIHGITNLIRERIAERQAADSGSSHQDFLTHVRDEAQRYA